MFTPVTTVLYLAVGIGTMVAFLFCMGDGDSRKFLASRWYTITGDRSLPTAVATLAVFALVLWPAIAAVWVVDRIAERRRP